MGIGFCCCGCRDGSVIDKWVNVTEVRNDDGTTTVPPYPRQDTAAWNTDNPSDLCSAHDLGFCGQWIYGGGGNGDTAGFSEQQIEVMVDDIMACGAEDSTHVTNDHNCYVKSGTVDMRVSRRYGFQAVLAKKCWHGIAGVNDQSDSAPAESIAFTTGAMLTGGGFGAITYGFNETPFQNRYRTLNLHLSGTVVISGSPGGIYDGTYSTSADANSTVGRYTGIDTHSGDDYTTDNTYGVFDQSAVSAMLDMAAGSRNDIMEAFSNFTGGDMAQADPSLAYFTNPSTGVYELWSGGSYGHPDYLIARITWTDGYVQHLGRNWEGGTDVDKIIDSVTWTNTSVTFQRQRYQTIGGLGNTNEDHTATATYSDAYTNEDCCADQNELWHAWNMTDWNLSGLRSDELLAFAPLVLYDEVGPTVPNPAFPPATMDDYNGGLIDDALGNHPGDPGYTPTWGQIAWHDPHDMVWQTQDPTGGTLHGEYFTSASVPASVSDGTDIGYLITGLRTGDVIGHTQAGSERHFWFNFTKMRRLPVSPPTHPNSRWEAEQWGGWSESPLPLVSMRWMDQFEAQTDTELGLDHYGNLPQWWRRLYGSTLVGQKYVAATQRWPSVNGGRPCGADKFAVDQTTVCCITVNAAPIFTVALTGEATTPPADGSYIAVQDDGIYQVDSHTGTGPWVLTCTRKDDLPTGFQFAPFGRTDDPSYPVLGQLRWPTYPGICGRVAVTCTESGGVVTVATAAAQPWLRMNPATGTILVDLYKSDMSGKVQATLTRDSDSSFHFTHAAMPDYVWMTGRDVDYTKYTDAPRRTGVSLVWSFNRRAEDGRWSSALPTWDASTWYAGTSGCCDCDINQFTYTPNACAPVVGIVEDGSAETIGGYKLEMPASMTFDDTFGAFEMAAIMLTMPDPFWQRPFKPDCDASTFSWEEDDGTDNGGTGDYTDGDGAEHKFFAHRPWVEASTTMPGGTTLPSPLTLYYDSANQIAPPHYPFGFECSTIDGSYQSFETDWGFASRVCGSTNRFTDYYLASVECS